MAHLRTFGELYEAKVITEEDVVAAVDAFMADPSTTDFQIGAGYTLDLAAAVDATPFTKRMLVDPAMRDAPKRTAVRAAVLLARPL